MSQSLDFTFALLSKLREGIEERYIVANSIRRKTTTLQKIVSFLFNVAPVKPGWDPAPRVGRLQALQVKIECHSGARK